MTITLDASNFEFTDRNDTTYYDGYIVVNGEKIECSGNDRDVCEFMERIEELLGLDYNYIEDMIRWKLYEKFVGKLTL